MLAFIHQHTPSELVVSQPEGSCADSKLADGKAGLAVVHERYGGQDRFPISRARGNGGCPATRSPHLRPSGAWRHIGDWLRLNRRVASIEGGRSCFTCAPDQSGLILLEIALTECDNIQVRSGTTRSECGEAFTLSPWTVQDLLRQGGRRSASRPHSTGDRPQSEPCSARSRDGAPPIGIVWQEPESACASRTVLHRRFEWKGGWIRGNYISSPFRWTSSSRYAPLDTNFHRLPSLPISAGFSSRSLPSPRPRLHTT